MRRRDVARSKANRHLAEGEGDDRAVVAVAQRAVDDVDRHRRVLRVDRDSVGAWAAEVEGRVGVAARRYRHRAGAGEAVVRGEGRRVDQRVGGGGEAGNRAVRRRDVARSKANRHLAEGEGDDRAVVAVAQRAVDDVDCHRRVLRVDRDSVGAWAAEVEGRVGVAARRYRHRAGAGEAVIRREGRRVGLTRRVANQILCQAGHGAVRRRNVARSKANRHLAEGEGHDRAVVAVAERAVDNVDCHRRVLRVDRDSVGAWAAEVEGRVGVAARRYRHRAGAGEAVVRREGRGVGLTSGSPTRSCVRPVTVPCVAAMSLAVKPTGTSLKVKVTTELLSPSLSEPSTMLIASVGFCVSIVTVSEPGRRG